MIKIKEVLKNSDITDDVSLKIRNEKLFENVTLKIPFDDSEAELYEDPNNVGYVNPYDLVCGGIQGRIPIKKYGEIAKIHHFANRNLLCGIFDHGKYIIVWDALTFSYLFNFRIESKKPLSASASTSISRVTASASSSSDSYGTDHTEEATTASGIENYLFLAYEKRILVVDLETRTINNLNNSGGIRNKKIITAIAVHPKMPILATCSFDGEVRLWDYQLQSSVLITESLFSASQNFDSQAPPRRYIVKFDRTGMFLVISTTDGNICAWGPPTQLLQQLMSETLADTSAQAPGALPGSGQGGDADGDGKSGNMLSKLTFYGFHRFVNTGDLFDFEFCDNVTQFFHFFSPIIMVLSRRGDISTWKLNFARKSSTDSCIVPFPFINNFNFGTKQEVLRKIAVRNSSKFIVHPTKNFMLSFPFGVTLSGGEYYAKLFSFSVDDVSYSDYIAPLPSASTSTSFNYASEYALFLSKQDLCGYSIMGNNAVRLRQAKPQTLITAETSAPGISFPVKMVASYEQKVCAIIYKVFGKNPESGDCDLRSASYRCTLIRTESGKQNPEEFPTCRDIVFCGKNDECYALLKEDGRTIESGKTQLLTMSGQPVTYSVGKEFCVEKMFHMPHSPVTGTAFLGCVRDIASNRRFLTVLSRENEFRAGEPVITFEKAALATVTVKNSCDPERLSQEHLDEIDILLSKRKRGGSSKKGAVAKKGVDESLDEVPVQVAWQKSGADEIGAVLTSHQRIYLVERKTMKVIRIFDFGVGNCHITSIHWVGWVLLFTTATHLKAIYSDDICGVLPDRIILSTNNGINGTTVYTRPISLIDPLINAEVSFYQEFRSGEQDVREVSCRVRDIAVHFDWQRISTRTAARLSDAGIEDAAFAFAVNDTCTQTEGPYALIAQSIRAKHYETASSLIGYSLKNVQERDFRKEGISYLLKSVLAQNVATKEIADTDLLKNLIKYLYLLNDEEAVALYDLLHFGNFDMLLKERTPYPVDPAITATYKSIAEAVLGGEEEGEDDEEKKEGGGKKAKKNKDKAADSDSKSEAVDAIKPANVTHGSRAVPSVGSQGSKSGVHQQTFSFMWVDTPGQWFPLSVIESTGSGNGGTADKAKLPSKAHKAVNVISELRHINSTCDMPVSFVGNGSRDAELEAEDLDYPALGIDDSLNSVDESLCADVGGDDDSFLLATYGSGSGSGAMGYGTIRHGGSFSARGGVGGGGQSPASSGRGSLSFNTTMRSMQNMNKMRAKSISSDPRPKSPLLTPSKKPKQ